MSLFACAACGRREQAPPAPLASSAPPLSDAAPAPSASVAGDTDDPKSIAWAESVRLERWDEAERALDALSDADKARADVRYVRARTALARGEHAKALELLQGIEASLPLLTDDVAKHRAEAKLHVGPFAEAGEYFTARSGAAAQLKAATAFDKAKDAARARLACDRAIAAIGGDKRARAQEAEARAMRFRLAEKPGDTETADARWLYVHAPDLAVAQQAANAWPRLDPKHPITTTELMTRAKAFGDAGKIDEAFRAIDDTASAIGPNVEHYERLRAKGYVLYHARTRYFEAAKLLSEAATNGGKHAAEDAFHAARSLSRADKDDEAIAGYDAVAKKWPKTQWGDEATYFVPYLHVLHAEWQLAARGFDAYAKRYPEGIHKHDCARNRAIAHLMIKSYKVARQLFEQLSAEEQEPLASARMANMAALAAMRDGDKTHAVARWNDVARNRPLTYPALVARARLAEIGEAPPPTIDPAEAGAAPDPVRVVLPAPADLLHRLGLDADAEAALRERENAVTASAAGRSAEALCAAYGMLGRARRRFEVAQRNISNQTLAQAPGARTRWAWECTYPSPYEGHVRAAEAREKLPTGLIYAVMRQESGYDPEAVSPAKAVGLLQLLPETARTLATSMELPHDDARLTSPPYNIALGSHYLKELIDRFHGQAPLAIGAYNGGPEAIARWLSRAPGLELNTFIERIPYRETRDYIGRVMGNLARYGYLREGEAGVPKLVLALPSP